MRALANEQGLSGVMLDAVERLPKSIRPPQDALICWIGEVLKNYEQRYLHYQRAIAEMAAFYNARGYKMMLLKGYACSLNWPKPEHRPCGDIDIWQFGKNKEADALLTAELGVTIDNSRHHHTVFGWQGFMVENHYDFVNVHHHKSNYEIEAVFKQLGGDDSHHVDVLGERVYLPSPNLHALFLLRHASGHFAATELNLRQLLDWAFFVKTHGKEVDWEWLIGILDKFELRKIFDIFNAICVKDLGFEASLFPSAFGVVDDSLKKRVLEEIVSPEFSGEMPTTLLERVAFKLRRWKANGWKHKLCYKESMWSAFWSGVWNHLLKPSSI